MTASGLQVQSCSITIIKTLYSFNRSYLLKVKLTLSRILFIILRGLTVLLTLVCGREEVLRTMDGKNYTQGNGNASITCKWICKFQ